MTKHTTKALNTFLIFAILCAFCITPAAANNIDNIETHVNTGVIHMSEAFYTDEYRASENYIKTEKYYEEHPDADRIAYYAFTKCRNPDDSIYDCVIYNQNDPNDPHPYWADWLELEQNMILKTISDDDGHTYTLIYPPKQTEPEKTIIKPWLLPGANAILPCVPAMAVAEPALYALAGVAGAVFMGEMANQAANTPHTNQASQHKYTRLDNKYNHRVNGELSFNEAVKHMKKCGDPNVKTDSIWIGSTEEGCKALAEAATKALGGKGPVYHPRSKNQPAHYHASQPTTKGDPQGHCKAHCFWDYTDFNKQRK